MSQLLKFRLGFAVLAACSALTGASKAFAQPAPAVAPAAAAPAAPEAPRGLLMQGFDAIGAGKALDDAKITISGFGEASWTYSDSSPPGNVIGGRVFDIDNQDITLNQIDLAVERTVNAADNKWDVGFRAEAIYGGDSRFIHSNGMDFYGPGSFQQYPDEQVDLVQAYVDVAMPFGNGVRLRAGKFVTLLGQETINPTTNALYSHSFLFGYAIPFTETGFYLTYALNDKITIDAGLTRGWNQSLKDNNGDAIDFLGRVTYVWDADTSILLSTTIGPEAAGDPGNWWYVFDGIVTHKMGDQLSIAFNADYGLYNHGSTNGTAAQWYGLAGYASYVINPMFTVNARAEIYDDTDGFTLAGIPCTVYEATLGVAIHPLPDDKWGKSLVVRPEIRYDYADESIFDGGTDNTQFTAAVDVIYSF